MNKLTVNTYIITNQGYSLKSHVVELKSCVVEFCHP